MDDRILLRSENICVPAILNNTVAACDFRKRLPVTLSGMRSADSYCFSTAIGCFDPEEKQTGWKNGDISISGGRLRIYFGGEETSANCTGIMVIASVSEKDLHLIKSFSKNIRLKIEAAEQNTDNEQK